MLKPIEHEPLAPVLTDQVIVPKGVINDVVETLNEAIAKVNSIVEEIKALSAKVDQNTADLASLAKIVEGIYNET